MEMREPSSVPNAAEEQTLQPAPAAASAEENQASEFETVDNTDPEEAAEMEMTEGFQALTREALLDKAAAVLAKDASEISTDDIRYLRQQFNAFRRAAETGTEEAPQDEAVASETEDAEFKDILNRIREKKAEYTAKVEAERAENLRKKEAVIAEIIALAEDTDNVNRTFPRYRELQDEFNAIGDVPATDDTSVWKRFQEARERYSDNLKINKELRDYDFKKNLDSKQLILDESEKLVAEEDVITAYKRLQELHIKWRQIGPVAK